MIKRFQEEMKWPHNTPACKTHTHISATVFYTHLHHTFSGIHSSSGEEGRSTRRARAPDAEAESSAPNSAPLPREHRNLKKKKKSSNRLVLGTLKEKIQFPKKKEEGGREIRQIPHLDAQRTHTERTLKFTQTSIPYFPAHPFLFRCKSIRTREE